MSLIVRVFVALVALEHLFICWMEMFAWETVGKKYSRRHARRHVHRHQKYMAANQGCTMVFWSQVCSGR